MENNNWKWYEDNRTGQTPQNVDAPYGGEQGGAPYPYAATPDTQTRKGGKKRFSWLQFIAAMLLVALIAGASGAGINMLFEEYRTQAAAPENGSGDNSGGMVIDENAAGDADADALDNSQKASEGITLGSTWTSEDSVSEMLQKSMSTVVGIDIISEVSTGSYWYGESGSTSEKVGSGSGVILTADGYIATCSHVVSGAGTNGSIKVYLQDGTAYDAIIVGQDDLTDLAIIKIDAQNLPAASVGSSAEAVVGDRVYAIGNPLGVFASSVTDGIVSGLDRLVTIDDVEMTLMQTDAAVNPGNSGGGLFNSAGELIGIVNSKATGENVEGIGFAIPIDSALPILRDLMDLGYVSGRPYLGITPVDVYMNGTSSYFGFQSYVTRVQVHAVEAGSAADNAGVKAGDVILTFDGQDVYGAAELSRILYEYKIGDTVKISVLRDNAQLELTLTLGARAN